MSNISNTKSKRSMSMTVATALMMVGLVFSKCSGFLRDIFVSARFEDMYRDAFTLAFMIPDIVFDLLIGGAIQSAITPTLASAVARGEEEKGWRAVNIFISVFSVIVIAVCVLGVIFSEPMYMIFRSEEKGTEVAHLAAMASKWLFPQIFFMMLAALSIGILNSYKRFGSTAFGPTVYNICVLASILMFAGNSEHKLMMTTAGIMVAAGVYFMFQLICGHDILSRFRFTFKPGDREFHALVKTALPILLSASVVRINMAILNFFAEQIPQHVTFLLRNASTVWQLPYGIFAVAIGSVMLPSIASLYGEKKYPECSALLSSRLKSALFLTIPSAGFMVLMNVDVIKAVFQWSSNYTDDNAQTAGTFLIGYSAAIITHTVIFIMNQAFYGMGKTKIPLFAGCIGLITNPLFCTIFISMGFGLISLTFAYSITSLFQLLTLCIIYYKSKDTVPLKMLPFACKAGLSVLVMCVVLFVFDRAVPAQGSKMLQLMILAGKGLVCVFVYFGFALIMKMPEATDWITSFKSKIASKLSRKSH